MKMDHGNRKVSKINAKAMQNKTPQLRGFLIGMVRLNQNFRSTLFLIFGIVFR
jgi:hypothetical protein